MSASADIEIRLLLEAIYLRFHYDFRAYSIASMRRRIASALSKLGVATISGLQEKILHEPSSFEALLQFLTVQVSDMFRDPEYFRVLRERIVPVLQTYPSLKIWVAGCATGEEVYSIAILLREEGLLDRTMIYATDINPEGLQKARAGVYAIDRVAAFTENHRLAPPDYHLLVEPNRVFSLSTEPPVNYSRPSIDALFESAAATFERGLLALVLTGASADGAAGARAIQDAGGVVVVQSPESAEAKELPRATLERTTPVFVGSAAEIAAYAARAIEEGVR